MIRSFIAKVSHNSRCAPLRTVNFAKKPPSPVVTAGGTPSSGTNVSLIGSLTVLNPNSEHLLDVLVTVERRKVLDLFAGANKTRRNSQFVLNCDHHPTFATAVEFSYDQAGESDRLMKLARLTKCVAAGGGINHQQALVWCSRIMFGQASFNFV